MTLLLLLALALLNPHITPGLARPMTTKAICATKWGRDRRFVTTRMKQWVFTAYGVPPADQHLYEVDHLIPRELGGADDVRNLWPQSWTGPLNAHLKDHEENRLHRAVCAGEMTLQAAQQAMVQWGR